MDGQEVVGLLVDWLVRCRVGHSLFRVKGGYSSLRAEFPSLLLLLMYGGQLVERPVGGCQLRIGTKKISGAD